VGQLLLFPNSLVLSVLCDCCHIACKGIYVLLRIALVSENFNPFNDACVCAETRLIAQPGRDSAVSDSGASHWQT
jgi:hypothetical protein